MAAVAPFVLLLIVAVLAIRPRMVGLRDEAAMPTAAPASIMAIGVFGLAPLQQIPQIARYGTVPLALSLLALWAWIAAAFLRSVGLGRLGDHVRPPVGRFAIGTWVAGTAVLASTIRLELPGRAVLADLLGGIAILLWLWFLPLAATGLRRIAADPGGLRPSGVILLATVSTQSIAILLLVLFPRSEPVRRVAIGLICLGVVAYAVGALLILRRYLAQPHWGLAEDWENPNCILHGAMSITGLAAVLSGLVPLSVCYAVWLYAAAALVFVEALELGRLAARWCRYGWRRGLACYHVSQWSRNFTFGMFYAFTLALSRAFPAAAAPAPFERIGTMVLAFGAYVVLLLLVIEIGLFLSAPTRAGGGSPIVSRPA